MKVGVFKNKFMQGFNFRVHSPEIDILCQYLPQQSSQKSKRENNVRVQPQMNLLHLNRHEIMTTAKSWKNCGDRLREMHQAQKENQTLVSVTQDRVLGDGKQNAGHERTQEEKFE